MRSAAPILLALAVLAAGCTSSAPGSPAATSAATSPAASGCEAPAPGERTISLVAGGEDREVLVHVPKLDAAQGPPPALIALHGYTGTSAGLARTSGLSDRADEHGFVVAYPQALGSTPEWHLVGGWSTDPGAPADDRELIDAAIDWLITTTCVDPGRVFVAGHSQGGGMAGDAACALADRVAGVGLLSAVHFRGSCPLERPVAVYAFHAADDPVLPIDGGPIDGAPTGYPEVLAVQQAVEGWAAANGCDASPESSTDADDTVRLAWSWCEAPVVYVRRTTGGHDWSDAAADEMWAFFDSLPRR